MVDLHLARVQTVERRQPARRPFHVIEKVGEHPRLVDDHVRELRQAILGVLDPAGALDPRRVVGVRAPEADLVDPVGLAQQAIRQIERLEHLDGAARDPVGLADLERTVATVDDGRPDVGKIGHLRSQDQTGRPAPDDQDIDILGYPCGPLGDGRMRVIDGRVAGPVAAQIELHHPGGSIAVNAIDSTVSQ